MSTQTIFANRASFEIRANARSSIILKHVNGLNINNDNDQSKNDEFLKNLNLGSSLATYEGAILALVGGKALQCWRLLKYGLPVLQAFIVPTYVYSLHIERAGVEGLIDEVFSLDIHDYDDDNAEKSNLLNGGLKKLTPRESTMMKLDEIRQKIIDTPLMDEVVENIKMFVNSTKKTEQNKTDNNNDEDDAVTTFAVRSSGTAEDLASKSFAGQYDTFLYQNSVEEIVQSIKLCWASMFKSHILDYYYSHHHHPTSDNAPSFLKAPQMGVLIMEMIDAESSEVCFSRNIWGERSKIMIEAVPGQGEGLVGGEITPDRYVVNKHTGKTVYQEINTQRHKFVRAVNEENEKNIDDMKIGVKKIKLDKELSKSVLSSKNLKVTINE